MIGVFSLGIAKLSNLNKFLGEPWSVVSPFRTYSKIVGWGRKPNTLKARAYAKKNNIPFISLEDGFIRSLGLGVSGSTPYSLIMDDVGIYYDATQASRLEMLISTSQSCPKAEEALKFLVKHKISKYNQGSESVRLKGSESKVLVADQTYGDVSVSLGFANQTSFDLMLDSALKENPDATIIIKIHPDVLAGKKKGYLDRTKAHPRIQILSDNCNPLSLIEQVEKVYVVTSQMGFEAAMLGKEVHAFGVPWYASWGITHDRSPEISKVHLRRSQKKSVAEIFKAAYLDYPKYLNPVSKEIGTIFDLMEWIKINKEASLRIKGTYYCVGMSLWKRAIVKPFLSAPGSEVKFINHSSQAPESAQIVSWGVKFKDSAHLKMEDGFLRSVGLGSDLHRPVSLVLDSQGMYYDPFSKSELEHLLSTKEFDQELRVRAKNFRLKFLNQKLSKYNLANKGLIIDAAGKKIILVPGQVEDDASILTGSPQIQSNELLLKTVRDNNPDAFIMYKPHPDVLAGNRKGSVLNTQLADLVVEHANIVECLDLADEVHTMTSLSGFEALMRGKVVHCYGGPFYAGWGLTIDHFPLPHRQRKLSLDELVATVYLIYPMYILPNVEGKVSAESVLDYLAHESKKRNEQKKSDNRMISWIERKTRKLKALINVLKD